MSRSMFFVKQAALELGRLADKIAYTAADAMDDYCPELRDAEKCIEDIRFYLRERKEELAKEIARNL